MIVFDLYIYRIFHRNVLNLNFRCLDSRGKTTANSDLKLTSVIDIFAGFNVHNHDADKPKLIELKKLKEIKNIIYIGCNLIKDVFYRTMRGVDDETISGCVTFKPDLDF